MKKEDLPQEPGALFRLTRELCYVKNEEGKYETALSRGWNVKKEALDSAWDEVNERVEEARKAVESGEKKSGILFHGIEADGFAGTCRIHGIF